MDLKRNLLLMMLLVLLAGCHKETPKPVNTIDFSGNFDKNKRIVALSEVADSLFYIHLEFSPESLIGKISKIRFSENFLLIYDEILRKLLLFDKNGRFIRSISGAGKGPAEFIEITDVILDEVNNRIVILTFDKYLKVFSLDGRLSHIQDTKLYPIFGSLADNDLVYLYIPYPTTILTKGYFLYKQGLLKDYSYPLFKRKIENTDMHQSISRVEAYTFHDTLCFFEYDYDTIWGVTKKDKLIARWAFKHSSRYITPTRMRQHNYPENFYHFDYHLESDSFLFFSGVNKGKIARLIFNKNKKEFTDLKETDANIPGIQRFGFRNDFDNGFPFWPLGQINEKWFYNFIDAKSFLDVYSKISDYRSTKPAYKKQIESIASSLDELSNPIVMLVKFR